MATGIIVLVVIMLLAVAWGIHGLFGIPGVPTGKRWLLLLLGKRLPISIGEGLTWLPRWLCSKFEYDIREEEFRVIADNMPGIPATENITLTDGIEVFFRNLTVYYEIGHEEKPFTGWRRIFNLFGWVQDDVLYRYSSVRNEDMLNRIPQSALEGLRMYGPTFNVQELLGISLNGLDVEPPNREKINTSRAEIANRLLEHLKPIGLEWGVIIKRVVVGDIDPNERMKASLEAKGAALLNMQVVMVESNTQVQRAMIVLKNGGIEKPTHEELLSTIERLTVLDNQRIAAQTGGNFGRFAQNLVNLTDNALS